MSGIHRSCFVLVVLALFAAASSAQKPPAPPRLALLVQIAGPTIAGPTDVHLLVWDGGGTELMGQDAIHAGARSCQAQVRPEDVRDLKQDLLRSGAGRLRSRVVDGTADLPSTTVTFFLSVEGSDQSLANTFTFNVAEGAYSRVQQKINGFVRKTFADCDLVF